MKNLKLVSFLMILASSLMFIQCTSDPIAGPAGVDGVDGIAGTDGTAGVNGEVSCLECHSTGTIDEAKAAYSASGHAAGGAVGYAGGRASCSRCHSNEGYTNFFTGQDAADIAFPTAIGCKTCHALHDPASIAQGDTEFNLRNTAGTELIISEYLAAPINVDYGTTANACISCHQARHAAEEYFTGVANTDEFTIPNSHWGPHHGPQASIVEGIQLVNFEGGADYPSTQSPHRAGADCVMCHMGETESGTGGHSWKPNENNCTVCHTDGAPEGVFGYDDAMTELTALLFAGNALKADGVDGDGNAVYAMNDGVVLTGAQGKAVWNWISLNEDKSKGIHNPPYAKAALTNSIEALK